MNLRLIREPSVNGATLGSLYVNGHWLCWSLEDEIRERPNVEVDDWKIPGATAIPAGRYRVVLTQSKRFGMMMPEVLKVPGFTGVRFHSGNTIADTDGCILVGTNRAAGRIGGSRVAFAAVYSALEQAQPGDERWLTVENPA